tara:strand:+ start:25 stop:255 length:231 start_codon:yes stop_codon:yes gene_type:complete
MEAKNRVHRYYVEEHRVDLLAIDELGISMIECALSDLLLRFHESMKELKPIDIDGTKINYDKINEMLTIIKERQQE